MEATAALNNEIAALAAPKFDEIRRAWMVTNVHTPARTLAAEQGIERNEATEAVAATVLEAARAFVAATLAA